MCPIIYNSVSQTGIRVTPRFHKGAVWGSEKRKCVMVEEFYWRSYIRTYELKFVWRHSTVIIPPLISRRRSISAAVQKLPYSVVMTLSTARHSRYVGRNDQLSIISTLAVDFAHVLYIKYKHMLVFNCILDVLPTGRGSLVSCVAFLGFRELKSIVKRGFIICHQEFSKRTKKCPKLNWACQRLVCSGDVHILC
jgi:hypothetical protein